MTTQIISKSGSTGPQGPPGAAGTTFKGSSPRYFLYLDPADGLYKGVNNRTSVVDYSSATPSTVVSQVANAITTSGGSNKGTMEFSEDTWTWTSSYAFPAGVLVKPRKGTSLVCSSGTVTLPDFDAPHVPVFSGAGTFTGAADSAVRKVVPQWWGAVPNVADASGSNRTAWNAALAFAAAVRRPLWIAGNVNTNWFVHSTVTIPSAVHIEGRGGFICMDATATGNPPVLRGTALVDVKMDNFGVDGGSTYNADGTVTSSASTNLSQGIQALGATRVKLRRMHIRNTAFSAVLFSGTDVSIEDSRFEKTGSHALWNQVPVSGANKNVRIRNNEVFDYGLLGNASYNGITVSVATGTFTGAGSDIAILDNLVDVRNPMTRATPTKNGSGAGIWVVGNNAGAGNSGSLSDLSTALQGLIVSRNTVRNAGLGTLGYIPSGFPGGPADGWQGAAIQLGNAIADFDLGDNKALVSGYVGIAIGTYGNCSDGHVHDNVSDGCLNYGAGYECEATRITHHHNKWINNTGAGAFIAGSDVGPGGTFIATSGYHLIDGDEAYNNGFNGFTFASCPNTSFRNCKSWNNSNYSTGYSGYKFQTDNVSGTILGVTFIGNEAWDDRATKLQDAGIDTSARTSSSCCIGVSASHNKLDGNANNSLRLNTADAPTNDRIFDNLGYNPVGITSLTPGTSPWVYTSPTSPSTLYYRGGTAVAIVKNGWTLSTTGDRSVELRPNEVVTLSWSAPPTAVYVDVH